MSDLPSNKPLVNNIQTPILAPTLAPTLGPTLGPTLAPAHVSTRSPTLANNFASIFDLHSHVQPSTSSTLDNHRQLPPSTHTLGHHPPSHTLDHHPHHPLLPTQPTVAVVGSGEFGQALSTALTSAGYRVMLATRHPDRLSVDHHCGAVVSLEEGMEEAEVVVMAVPVHALPSVLHQHQHRLKGKVVVDAANRTSRHEARKQSPHGSSGEQTQALLPYSRVVKTLNTVSAYALMRGLRQGGTAVPLCGNDQAAKLVVSDMIRSLGYLPDDRGDIHHSKEVEDQPFLFFPDWKVPIIIGGVVVALFYLIMVFRYQLCDNFSSGEDWNFESYYRLILHQPQLTFAFSAYTLLALCYLPGVLAAYLQLWRRTKYSRFPSWLDRWLRARKQLGLLGLLLALMHAIGVLIETGEISRTWRTSAYFLCGILAFTLMAVLGVTSLPSVGATLTWREFSVVQRWGGWSALTLVTLHVVFFKWSSLLEGSFKCVVIAHPAQISLVLPLLTLLLKVPLLLPCADRALVKIRTGRTVRGEQNKIRA